MKAKRLRQTFAFFFYVRVLNDFIFFFFFFSELNIVWPARAFSFSSSKQLENFGSPFHDEFSLLNRVERTSAMFYLKSRFRRVDSKLHIRCADKNRSVLQRLYVNTTNYLPHNYK